jgi:hypothetical protein
MPNSIQGWLVWGFFQAVLTFAWKLIFKLAEHAVLGWGDDQIAEALGITSPSIQTIVTWAIPLALAFLTLWAYHLIQTHFFHPPAVAIHTIGNPQGAIRQSIISQIPRHLYDRAANAQALLRSNVALGWIIIVLAITGLIAGIAILTSQRSNTVASGIDTRIHLQFGAPNTLPIASDLQNIWRWYTLNNIVEMVPADGTPRREIKTWNIFITFDQPIDVKQIVINSDQPLPAYEVKDVSNRSAVIAFMSDLANIGIDIHALTGPLDAKDIKVVPGAAEVKSQNPPKEATVPAAPPAPPPRPLTAYEAEKKLRAIDQALDILSNDMQPSISDGPRLNNGWNALKDRKNYPNYSEELTAYTDRFKQNATKLDDLRARIPEYQDIVMVTTQTYYNSAWPAIQDYRATWQRMLYLDVENKMDQGSLDVFMKGPSNAFEKAIRDFTEWRNRTRGRLVELRREISP